MNCIFSFFVLILLLQTISIVFAMPTPHSIKGYVYDLDGLTQAKMKTQFVFTNMNTDYKINGVVGQGGFTGRFSVSMDGIDGDKINMFFWNKYHNTSKNITLSGIVDNLKITINDSYPNNPPLILSLPKTQIKLFEKYIYDVDAVDMQDDVLNYELITSPKGMVIDSFGIIDWSPSDKNIGDNTVLVRVTDSDGLYFEQSFVITVYEIKDTSNQHKNRRGGYIRYNASNNFVQKIKNIIFNINRDKNNNGNNENKLGQTLSEFTSNNNPNNILKEKIVETNLNKIKSSSKTNYPSIVKKRKQWLTGRVISNVENSSDENNILRKHFIFGKIISSESSTEKSLINFEDLFGQTKEFFSFFIFGNEYYFKTIDSSENFDILLSAKKNQMSGFSIINLSSKFIKQNIVLNESSYLSSPDKSFDNIDFYFERPYLFFNPIGKIVYAYIVDNNFNDNNNNNNNNILKIDVKTLTKEKNPGEFNLYLYNDGNYSLLNVEKNKTHITYLKNNSDEKYFALVYSNQNEIKKHIIESKKITKAVTELNPFIINGIAYLNNNEQVEFNTTIEFINLKRNKTFNTSTGIGINKGGFATVVYGLRNDSFQIKVSSKEISYVDLFVLEDDVKIELKP